MQRLLVSPNEMTNPEGMITGFVAPEIKLGGEVWQVVHSMPLAGS